MTNMTNMTKEQLLEEAESQQERLVSYRRYLHTHAETGFDLKDTTAFVKKALVEMGYEPKACGKAGLIVTAGGMDEAGKKENDQQEDEQKEGKVFLLRADMDALPISEEAQVDFRCDNGNMHACGHDLHTAMLLGAAKLLKDHEGELKGRVKLMFQPAEEIFQGSQDMIEGGVLENPHVDAALMIHVIAGMPFQPGTVVVCGPGVSAPAADYFTIKVQGKGCHGSMPNAGVDPLTVAAHILLGLQEIHGRELAMDDRAVLTIGTIHGGNAANAIADSAVMEGTLRTFDEETRAFIKGRMTEIAESIAKAYRATAKVEFGSGVPTLCNDADLSARVSKYVRELLGEEKGLSAEDLNRIAAGRKDVKNQSKMAGSEDFAYVSQQVPSIMLALAAGQPEAGYSYPQHHPMVTFDEGVLAGGSAVYAYTAMRWLEEQA